MGISDGSRPGKDRQQLAVSLHRHARAKDYAANGTAVLDAFSDHAGVSGCDRDAVAWAVGNGIFAGTSDGRLPEHSLRRFSIAFSRALQNAVF